MIVCPECATEVGRLSQALCRCCGWTSSDINGIPELLTRNDRRDPVVRRYIENYDMIARDDISQKILDEAFVRDLADNLLRIAGDVSHLDICDLGAGKGFATRELRRRGARSVVSIDVTSEYFSREAPDPDVIQVIANAESMPFADAFDLVISSDVMEHVLNLGSFLYCVNRSLRTGGRFVVRVPHRENLLQYSRYACCAYPFVHLRTFNKLSLRDCLEQAGFQIDRLSFDAFVPGRPHGFWMASPRRANTYYRAVRWLAARVKTGSHLTSLPAWILGILMPPQVITASARKVRKVTSNPAAPAIAADAMERE